MRIAPIIEIRDLWVGFYWDRKNRWLYFLPVPTVGLIFKFGRSAEEMVRDMMRVMDGRNLWTGVVEEEIIEEARDEAMRILDATDDVRREEFLRFHVLDQGNQCCQALDLAKTELVRSGKMTQEENDHFGNFPMTIDEKGTE